MDQFRVDAMSRFLSGVPSRRHLLRGLVGAGIGLGVVRLPDATEAKKKRRKKRPKKNTDGEPRCTRNGERCDRQGDNCQASYCLKAPFTIEAIWESNSLHYSYLYVPPNGAAVEPVPYTYYDCNPVNSACDERYPFACGVQSEQGPGDQIITVYKLLPGTYEFWIGLDTPVAAGELVIVLRDSGGRVVREWTNPADATNKDPAWRVFDVAADGSVRSINATLAGFYHQSSDVCPYKALARRDRDRAATRARRDRS